MVSGAEFFAEDADDAQREPVEVGIWECNAETVAIFEACSIDLVGGMAASYHGISARELQSACDLFAAPHDDRREIAEDVQWMGRVVTAALNRRIAESPKGR